jgi:type IV pilus assembly protein PilY1
MKLLEYILFFLIIFSTALFAKSPPPGTGTADVPANILIMLDNSGSMAWDINGNERYANTNYTNRPFDVKVDTNGDVYVNEFVDRRIRVLSSDGTLLRTLFGYGSGCNQVYLGYKFDIYGDYVYYLDHYGQNYSRGVIKIVNKNTNRCVGTIPAQHRQYSYLGITVSEKYIFIANYDGRIEVYNRTSRAYITTYTTYTRNNTQHPYWSRIGYGTWDLAVNSTGTKIAVAMTKRGLVCEYTLSGHVIDVDGFSSCNQVGVSRSENDVFNSNIKSGDGYFYQPTGVAYDSDDNIFVTDQNHKNLQKFNSSGTFVKSYGSYNNPWMFPRGVGVGPDDTVYVAGYLKNKIFVFDNPAGGLTFNSTMGTPPSRLSMAKKVIKKIVSNSELTSGANFGLMEWGHPYRSLRRPYPYDEYQGWRYNWYGTRVRVHVSANGAKQIFTDVDNIKAGGGTYLYQALNLAKNEFSGRYSPIIKGASCQLNYLIVISDGDWAQSSYVNNIARQLANQNPNIKTFAVGFATGGNKSNYTNLATAGGTVTPLYAENSNELFTKLSEAIKQISGSTLTFTTPAITTDASKGNYIYQSTFTYAKNTQWKGYLKKYKLNADGSFGKQEWDAAALLNDQSASSRKIWTSGIGNISTNNFTTTYLDLLKPKLFSKASPTDDDVTDLINFVRGLDSYDEDDDGNTSESRHKLGDIYHADINIVGAPEGSMDYNNEYQTAFYRSENNYSRFKAQYRNRKEVVYAGANDGMLHAFDAITGKELWAFIPPSLLPKLSTMVSVKANSSNSIYGVDGSAVVKDIYYDDPTDSTSNRVWKTILISGLGSGGHSFFALDVTDPDDPKHFFTIHNDPFDEMVTIWDANGDDEIFPYTSPMKLENDYRKLGETWSAPRIIKMKIGSTEKWVAVAGGGYNGSTNPDYGSAVFIIDLENRGKLLNKVDITDKSNIDIVNSVPADLTLITADGTENAKYHGALVYVTDLEGKITKVNLTDKGNLYETTEVFNSESTTTNGRYVYKNAEATIINDTLWLYYGTGNTQKLQDKNQNTLNRVYGIKDKYFPNFTSVAKSSTIKQCKTAPTCPNSSDIGWYVNLRNGQRLSAAPTIDKDRVYFPLYEPTQGANICNPGKAILRAYNAKCGNSVLNVNLGAGVLSKVVVEGGNLYVGIAGEADTKGTGFTSTGNLITGKSQAKGSGGKVQLEGWKEN